MSQPIDVPTAASLADLVARCEQIHRYATQLTVAEESRVAALADGLVTMRHVLELPEVPRDRLPSRHARMSHWWLTGPVVAEAETPPVAELTRRSGLVLDEHGQVKVLGDRSWRGEWRSVVLWRDGVAGLQAADLMEYLAGLAALAHQRAPEAARRLVSRHGAVVATRPLTSEGPRSAQAARAAR
ncbi:MAG TPA: hypothetical protein VEA99_00930 [Gemmatimonadaceae bacterium]|nr:hypothetical protein [Gemmatimonadaceae bacterium]